MVLSSTAQKALLRGKRFFQTLPAWLFMLVFSPVLLLINLFAPRSSRRIFLMYLLFLLIISGLTITAYCRSIRETRRLETTLGEFFHPAETRVHVAQEIKDIVYKYAVRFDLNPHLILAVIQVESSFNPYARSPKGACGLMQITPLVWQYYNPGSGCNGRHRPENTGHGNDCIYAVEANIRTGMQYLRDLIDYFQGETGPALEAYNAGLTNVDRTRVRPKYQETRNYLQRIGTVLAPAAQELTEKKLQSTSSSRLVFQRLAVVSLFLWVLLALWFLKHFPKQRSF